MFILFFFFEIITIHGYTPYSYCAMIKAILLGPLLFQVYLNTNYIMKLSYVLLYLSVVVGIRSKKLAAGLTN